MIHVGENEVENSESEPSGKTERSQWLKVDGLKLGDQSFETKRVFNLDE